MNQEEAKKWLEARALGLLEERVLDPLRDGVESVENSALQRLSAAGVNVVEVLADELVDVMLDLALMAIAKSRGEDWPVELSTPRIERHDNRP